MSVISTTTTTIPAVLIVSGNKTYGRTPNGRLLYRAVPNNKTLPSVLVPYEEKINFCKAYKNKYILMRYIGDDRGEITETIGPVDILANCYRYELYCKGLVIPMPTALKAPIFPVATATTPTHTPFSSTMPSPAPYIFTIDGETTKDFDDAFSITHDATTKETIVNIYIANVPLVLAQHPPMLHALGTGNRMSTIYLPDKNVPMLPPRLSEHICSLAVGADSAPTKQCLVLSIHISQQYGTITRHQYSLQAVTIAHNYVYDSAALLAAQPYKQLAAITRTVFERAMFDGLNVGPQQQQQQPTFNFMAVPTTSADIVAYWMLMMNFICATDLRAMSAPAIYRVDKEVDKESQTQSIPPPSTSPLLDAETDAAIRRYCATTMAVGEYNTTAPLQAHKTLGVAQYCHITSPIRRLADVVNMASLILAKNMVSDPTIKAQLERFVAINTEPERIDFMNHQMQAIKKAQRSCDLLAICQYEHERRTVGIVFAMADTDTAATKWDIYLPSLKLFTTINVPLSSNLRPFDKVNCRVHMFDDEASFKRKVRVSMVD